MIDEYLAKRNVWKLAESALVDGELVVEIAELGPIDLYPHSVGSGLCSWVRTTAGKVIFLSEEATQQSRYNYRVGQVYILTVANGVVVKAILR